MDQNFQTSFIPKKPIVEERAVGARPIGLFTILSIFVLIAVLAITGGMFLYKGVVVRNTKSMKASLVQAENRFEPSKIAELQNLDKRLNAASEVLKEHITVAPIFNKLQELTMKTVRYNRFGYETSMLPDSKVAVHLTGQAIGYRSIALQADLFTADEQLIDPIFSNLVLDDKGNVSFDLNFYVDRTFVNYKQTLQTTDSAPVVVPESVNAVETSLPTSAAPSTPAFPTN